MIDKNYLQNIPDPKINILHNSIEHNLTSLSYNTHTLNEVNNLILNSNLDDSNVIK